MLREGQTPLFRGMQTVPAVPGEGCAAVISGSSRSPFVSGLDCAFRVSPFATQSTAEAAACAAELHIATSALPPVRQGGLGRSSLLGKGCRNQLREGLPTPKVHDLLFKSHVGLLGSIRQTFSFGRVKGEALKVLQSELQSHLDSSVPKVWDLI